MGNARVRRQIIDAMLTGKKKVTGIKKKEKENEIREVFLRSHHTGAHTDSRHKTGNKKRRFFFLVYISNQLLVKANNLKRWMVPRHNN